MSESSKSGQSDGGGIGFCGLLTILFIALKLTGYINWSWLWVLSPMWIPLVVVLLVLLALLIVWAVCTFAVLMLERK